MDFPTPSMVEKLPEVVVVPVVVPVNGVLADVVELLVQEVVLVSDEPKDPNL